MKIFMLTPYLPYPLYSGGQIRSYQLLKFLARRHQITLVSLIRKDEEKQYLKDLQPFCERIIVVRRRKAWSIVNILFAAFSLFPFLIAIYYSLKLKKLIARELTRESYDLIHAETFYIMPNIPETKVPILLVEQTIEFKVYQHFAHRVRPFVVKPLLYFDVIKLKFWEQYFWKKATRVVAMSLADKNAMLEAIPSRDIDIVPNGVDLSFFEMKIHPPESEPVILFVGNFNWLQNREAVEELVHRVWPKIEAELPEAQLWIVGRNPTERIREFASDSIRVETIDDIRDAFTRAHVLVAPLAGPGGTRYKILEAMAAGVPVVTTKVGIEGIASRDGHEVIVRDTERLSEGVIELVRNPQLYRLIARNARKLIEKQYDWRSIATGLDALYRDVGRGGAA